MKKGGINRNDPLSRSEVSNTAVCAAVPHQYVSQAAESQSESQMANSLTNLPPIQLQQLIDHSPQWTLTINNDCSVYFLTDFLPQTASFFLHTREWHQTTTSQQIFISRLRFSTLIWDNQCSCLISMFKHFILYSALQRNLVSDWKFCRKYAFPVFRCILDQNQFRAPPAATVAPCRIGLELIPTSHLATFI